MLAAELHIPPDTQSKKRNQEVRRGPQHHLHFHALRAFYFRDSSHSSSKAGLFSAVSSVFVIDTQSKLQLDLKDQSAAFLRAILLTCNHSAIRAKLRASLLISLLAVFIAMLGKQWLTGTWGIWAGSMIDHCGGRQCECGGLQKCPFHLLVSTFFHLRRRGCRHEREPSPAHAELSKGSHPSSPRRRRHLRSPQGLLHRCQHWCHPRLSSPVYQRTRSC